MVFRFHTFLFADLVGFTSFTVRHGDERAADLAVCFQERVCALAATHGCHVVKTIGDAVMVRSDNGDAAIELGQAILALAAEVALPRVRVGLDTGPAAERNGDWFGSTVNTASRVSAGASAAPSSESGACASWRGCRRTRSMASSAPAVPGCVTGRRWLSWGAPQRRAARRRSRGARACPRRSFAGPRGLPPRSAACDRRSPRADRRAQSTRRPRAR